MTGELLLDRRSVDRVAVASRVIVRPIGGFNQKVELADVSIEGCRVELVDSAEPGDILITRFPELEPLVGLVKWDDGRTAGMKFSRRIHPAVFDALVARLPANQRHQEPM